MSKVIELSRPVKPVPSKRVCLWIIRFEGQRARVPATFRQILRIMPAILDSNGSSRRAVQ